MKNDIQDKQYLALELTKICYGNKGEEYADDTIFDTYEHNLRKLTNTFDEIETISSLKNEIDKLQEENKRLKKNNQDNLKPLINDMLTIAKGCQGDMEPYVYESIVSNCKRYEK